MSNSPIDAGTMTLGEAMREMRTFVSESDMTDRLPADIAAILEQHDAIHILFNCGTSIQDEIAVHIWMLFATDVKIHTMHQAVAHREHRQALSDIGHFQLLQLWSQNILRIFGILRQIFQMKKKLVMAELPRWKSQSILAIRQEYGIKL